MWFNSGYTSSTMHAEDNEGLLCVYDGHEEIVMMDYDKYRQVADVRWPFLMFVKLVTQLTTLVFALV